METLSHHSRIGLVDYKLSMTTRGINILLNILALLSLHPSNLNQPLMQILAGCERWVLQKLNPNKPFCFLAKYIGSWGILCENHGGVKFRNHSLKPKVSPCSVWQQCPRYGLRILDCRSTKIPPDLCRLEYHKLQGV